MKKYLGKNPGKTKVELGQISPKVKLRGIVFLWFLPLIVFGFLGASFKINQSQKTAGIQPSTNLNNIQTSVLKNNGSARYLADAPANPTKTCSEVVNGGGTDKDGKKIPGLFDQANAVGGVPTFPLIPAEFLSSDVNGCNPARWNFDVFNYFAYKVLAIAYYVAYILTILLTIIAGLYYISGFASEANVKKGKSILISTYVGLLIVMLARLILFGSFNILTGKDANIANINGSSQTF